MKTIFKVNIYFRMLEDPTNILNINCMDPLGCLVEMSFNISTDKIHFRRTALLMAIDNENMEMLELLLENKVNKIDFFFKKTLASIKIQRNISNSE